VRLRLGRFSPGTTSPRHGVEENMGQGSFPAGRQHEVMLLRRLTVLAYIDMGYPVGLTASTQFQAYLFYRQSLQQNQ